jgi:hypothetical protein
LPTLVLGELATDELGMIVRGDPVLLAYLKFKVTNRPKVAEVGLLGIHRYGGIVQPLSVSGILN